MHSKEPGVTKDSQYFLYVPSAVATRVYLYPVISGIFRYEPGYYLRRGNFDNYLLMYVNKGTLELRYESQKKRAREGQVVLIDCSKPHEYGNLSNDVLELYWLHFKGALAEAFYSLITEYSSHVISPKNTYPFTHHLKRIYELFKTCAPVHEADLSRRITDMLSELAGVRAELPGEDSSTEIMESALAFINEHFRENLTLEMMARHASLSPYYFTRLFSAETGFTPHQYLIATRINYARYLLQSGEMSVKEIAFASGFNSESGFCSTFRKWEGITPGEFRGRIRG